MSEEFLHFSISQFTINLTVTLSNPGEEIFTEPAPFSPVVPIYTPVIPPSAVTISGPRSLTGPSASIFNGI